MIKLKHQLTLFERLQRTLSVPKKEHSQVRWISHHIPKTAGTSVRKALEQSVGRRAVYGAYALTGANLLSNGDLMWLPKRIAILHGHFKPHPLHSHQFPNAKRITWLRDPIDRAWSMLGHMLSYQQPTSKYAYLKMTYLDRGITQRLALFELMIKDPMFNSQVFCYQDYFEKVGLEQFDFVGCVENFETELARLSDLLNVELPTKQENTRKHASDISLCEDVRRRIKPFFEKEYVFYNKACDCSS